jgi:hypothetical protein
MDLPYGSDEADLWHIASFNGASKRLEKIAESRTKVAYKDLPIPPVKVRLPKQQYPDRTLVAACRVTHDSSLNAEFQKNMKEPRVCWRGNSVLSRLTPKRSNWKNNKLRMLLTEKI